MLDCYTEKSVTIHFPCEGIKHRFLFKIPMGGIKSKKDCGSFFNEPCIMVDISIKRE